MNRTNTMKFTTLRRRILIVGLLAGVAGLAYSNNSNWIFCSSFEQSEANSSGCQSGNNPPSPKPGKNGNLWNQMYWNQGSWQ